jgi:hypothetical protein
LRTSLAPIHRIVAKDKLAMRNLLTLSDLSAEEIRRIFALSCDLKDKYQAGVREPLLPGRVMALLFEKPSLRTRVSFQSLPSISKSVLEELEVVVPPMEKQSTILKINELRNREVAIKRQLEYLRGIEIQQKLLKAANNHIHGE